MNNAWLPLALTIAGGVLYQFAQKSVPRQANPFATIIVAYLVGIACCLIALRWSAMPWRVAFAPQSLHWTMAGIGIGAALIEIGFLLVYRAGWYLSEASVMMSISVALLSVPLGLVFFRERLSWINAFGIAFCLLGLLLLTRK
jgi:drug/metabolite transporter (DMT)-like permease